jgi:hypothetical protein
MHNICGGVKIRKVATHLPRSAGLCPKRGKLRKVAVHLPRLAGKATGGSPAMVSRFEPRKLVWLNLLTSAGEWSLIKPAACGWCSLQTSTFVDENGTGIGVFFESGK